MERPAERPALRRDPSAADVTPPTGTGSERRNPGLAPSRRTVRRPHLRSVVTGLGLLAVAWLVFVVANAVAGSSAVADEAARMRAENARLEARLEQRRRELELVKSDDYVILTSRAYGMGRADEHAFALAPGAPPPPRILPLGDEQRRQERPSPLEEWLSLLFGR